MSAHEAPGKTDEWYTPAYVFEAMGDTFDLDVAAPESGDHIPATDWCKAALTKHTAPFAWRGFVWMNPPFGKRNGLAPWLDKFFAHGNGVALTPDRTSTDWWQDAALRADRILFVRSKIKFLKPDGTTGNQPGTGTTLFASGLRGCDALERAAANGLGFLATHVRPHSIARAVA